MGYDLKIKITHDPVVKVKFQLLRRLRKTDDGKFKSYLDYRVSSKLSWATW